LVSKDRFEINRVGHGLAPGISGMQVVAAIVIMAEPVGMNRITQQQIEVDDSVEHAARPDPIVDAPRN